MKDSRLQQINYTPRAHISLIQFNFPRHNHVLPGGILLLFTKSTSSWTCYAGFCFLVCFWIYCAMHLKLKLKSWATTILYSFQAWNPLIVNIIYSLLETIIVGNVHCNINFGKAFSDHFSASANFVPFEIIAFFQLACDCKQSRWYRCFEELICLLNYKYYILSWNHNVIIIILFRITLVNLPR